MGLSLADLNPFEFSGEIPDRAPMERFRDVIEVVIPNTLASLEIETTKLRKLASAIPSENDLYARDMGISYANPVDSLVETQPSNQPLMEDFVEWSAELNTQPQAASTDTQSKTQDIDSSLAPSTEDDFKQWESELTDRKAAVEAAYNVTSRN